MHAAIAGTWILITRIVVHRQRGPNAVRWRVDRKAKGPWHDSDDGIKITAEVNSTPDDRLVGGELRLPQRVTDENHSRSRFLFIRSESAAKFRTDSERRDQIPGHYLRIHAQRPLLSRQNVGTVVIGNQMFERVVLRAPIKEIGIAYVIGLRIVRVKRLRLDEPLRLIVGQRPQHDCIDHAEDRRIGADPQRKRDHGNSREAGILAQLPQSVAKILYQVGEHVSRPSYS